MPSSKLADPVPCLRCHADTERLLSAAAAVGFQHHPTGPKPQNTGVSTIDHDVDRIIGRDSELRLGEMQKRQDKKKRLIDRTQVTGYQISRQDDGEYFVMSESEMKAAKKARILHQDAMQRINGYLASRNQKKGGSP